MNEEAVEPQADIIDQVVEQAVEQAVQENDQIADSNSVDEQTQDKTMVPLSALQKIREKKRELELELQWERQRNAQQQSQKPVEEDNSRYESATREDLNNSQEAAIRAVEERLWMRQNPEKYEKVNEFLPQFLKQRPNLASAINQATNRYEEAYLLMDALTPKQQSQMKSPPIPKKEAPNAPGGIPKAAAMNQSIDVMNMSDSEFAAWRKSKKRTR